ncbi:hypothetical protein [Paenibacillus antibioticophila]|uniref:hypothetical protein n=1 Tax=Paenibacillus antibioticophila TaxID=1274374 RepID=UPI001BB3CB19|nr:hypothetical protein [Paenibacillus antibioticophila]
MRQTANDRAWQCHPLLVTGERSETLALARSVQDEELLISREMKPSSGMANPRKRRT